MTVIEISCRHVWNALSDYLESDIDPQLRRRMEAHFKVCEHCRAILNGTRNVVQLVGDGVAFDVPAGFSDRLHNRLAEHFRRQE
jgi:predicted anti-sigma-YlaC factor YlaD